MEQPPPPPPPNDEYVLPQYITYDDIIDQQFPRGRPFPNSIKNNNHTSSSVPFHNKSEAELKDEQRDPGYNNFSSAHYDDKEDLHVHRELLPQQTQAYYAALLNVKAIYNNRNSCSDVLFPRNAPVETNKRPALLPCPAWWEQFVRVRIPVSLDDDPVGMELEGDQQSSDRRMWLRDEAWVGFERDRELVTTIYTSLLYCINQCARMNNNIRGPYVARMELVRTDLLFPNSYVSPLWVTEIRKHLVFIAKTVDAIRVDVAAINIDESAQPNPDDKLQRLNTFVMGMKEQGIPVVTYLAECEYQLDSDPKKGSFVDENGHIVYACYRPKNVLRVCTQSEQPSWKGGDMAALMDWETRQMHEQRTEFFYLAERWLIRYKNDNSLMRSSRSRGELWTFLEKIGKRDMEILFGRHGISSETMYENLKYAPETQLNHATTWVTESKEGTWVYQEAARNNNDASRMQQAVVQRGSMSIQIAIIEHDAWKRQAIIWYEFERACRDLVNNHYVDRMLKVGRAAVFVNRDPGVALARLGGYQRHRAFVATGSPPVWHPNPIFNPVTMHSHQSLNRGHMNVWTPPHGYALDYHNRYGRGLGYYTRGPDPAAENDTDFPLREQLLNEASNNNSEDIPSVPRHDVPTASGFYMEAAENNHRISVDGLRYGWDDTRSRNRYYRMLLSGEYPDPLNVPGFIVFARTDPSPRNAPCPRNLNVF